MAGRGFDADQHTLHGAAAKLQDAEGAVSHAPPPTAGLDAGPLTAAFQALAGQLCDEANRYSAELAGAANAVRTNAAEYAHVDEEAKRTFRPDEEKPGNRPPAPPVDGSHGPVPM